MAGQESVVESTLPVVFHEGPLADMVDAHTDVAREMAHDLAFLAISDMPQVVEVFTAAPLDRGDVELDEFNVGTYTSSHGRQREVEVVAVDLDELHDSIRVVMAGLAASAYVQGRVDAALDITGSNEPKFVRARNLRAVIDKAVDEDFDPIATDPTKAAKWLGSFRGILKRIGNQE